MSVHVLWVRSGNVYLILQPLVGTPVFCLTNPTCSSFIELCFGDFSHTRDLTFNWFLSARVLPDEQIKANTRTAVYLDPTSSVFTWTRHRGVAPLGDFVVAASFEKIIILRFGQRVIQATFSESQVRYFLENRIL